MKKLNVKFSVKNMAYMALLIALHLVLCYVDEFIPQMPQGGTILSLAVIPVFIASYLLGPGYGAVVGFLSALLQLALGLVEFYTPWSLILDYIIPNTVIGLAAIIPSLSVIKGFKIHFGIIITMILRYTSNVLSGVLLFASYAPEGTHPLIYSLGYNFPYTFVTCIFAIVVLPFLLKPLSRVIKVA